MNDDSNRKPPRYFIKLNGQHLDIWGAFLSEVLGAVKSDSSNHHHYLFGELLIELQTGAASMDFQNVVIGVPCHDIDQAGINHRLSFWLYRQPQLQSHFAQCNDGTFVDCNGYYWRPNYILSEHVGDISTTQ